MTLAEAKVMACLIGTHTSGSEVFINEWVKDLNRHFPKFRRSWRGYGYASDDCIEVKVRVESVAVEGGE